MSRSRSIVHVMLGCAFVSAILLPAPSHAVTVTNGGFESGNLSGWTVVNSGSGNWFVATGNFNGKALTSPPEGQYAATTDQTGPGSHLLMQAFALEEGATHDLSLVVYYRSFASPSTPSPDSLDETTPINQQYRVEILRAGAQARTVAASDILLTLFRTQTGDPLTMSPKVLSADLSPNRGTTVTLRVAEVDNRGNFRASVDAVKLVTREVDTALESAPPARTAETSATFEMSSSHPDAEGFECSLDGAEFAACASPVAVDGLAEGSHEFAVRAIARGVRDATPALYTWDVDLTPPDASFVSGPPRWTTSGEATVEFALSEEGTFECALDAAPFAPCTSPWSTSGLLEGDHALAVRGTDSVGNVGDAATYVWGIDRTGPVVTVDHGGTPLIPRLGSVVSGTARDLEAGVSSVVVTFTSLLDGTATTRPAPCGCPGDVVSWTASTAGLAPGPYAISAVGTDVLGNSGGPSNVAFVLVTG